MPGDGGALFEKSLVGFLHQTAHENFEFEAKSVLERFSEAASVVQPVDIPVGYDEAVVKLPTYVAEGAVQVVAMVIQSNG